MGNTSPQKPKDRTCSVIGSKSEISNSFIYNANQHPISQQEVEQSVKNLFLEMDKTLKELETVDTQFKILSYVD